MARALIIKNADFSVNKLDTVVFNDIPCTGITINKNTLTMTSVGSTSTITATVTPSDTTDAIIWSSSNTDVVTVAGGVVTQVGVGTATITATCGNYTATCAVTATHVVNLATALNRYLAKDSNKDFLSGGDLNNYAIGFSASGVNSRRISTDDLSLDRYPIMIPSGATKIQITAENFNPYGFWTNTQRAGAYSDNIAYAPEKDADFGAVSVHGNRTITIPDRTSGTYAGVDSCAFVFRYTSGTITQELVDEVVITFTAD